MRGNAARDGLIFLIRFAHGITYRSIGNMFGISVERVRQVVARQARRVRSADLALACSSASTPSMKRLRSAGALPTVINVGGWRQVTIDVLNAEIPS